MFILYVVTDNN